jgi:hypothetical protein
LLEDSLLDLLIVNALRLSLEFADLIREGYSKDSFMGTRVSGRKTAGLKLELNNLGVSIPFVSRGTMSSD